MDAQSFEYPNKSPPADLLNLFVKPFISAFIIPTITPLQYLIGKAGPKKEEAVM